VGITTYVPEPMTSGAEAEGRFDKSDFIFAAHPREVHEIHELFSQWELEYINSHHRLAGLNCGCITPTLVGGLNDRRLKVHEQFHILDRGRSPKRHRHLANRVHV
jgi:hypothetical protein